MHTATWLGFKPSNSYHINLPDARTESGHGIDRILGKRRRSNQIVKAKTRGTTNARLGLSKSSILVLRPVRLRRTMLESVVHTE
jgi:hypothetical protein